MGTDSSPVDGSDDRSGSGDLDPVELLRVVLHEAARRIQPPASLMRSLLGAQD